nr:hypothetical protein [Tanacetum cinerariifolium]
MLTFLHVFSQVKSSPNPTNKETNSPAGGARGSPVPTSFHDDPYMLVRHAYTPIATDTKSEPYKDSIETKDPQLLPITSAPIPSPDYTPVTPHTNEESEPFKTSETRVTSPHSTTPPSDSTSPLSFDHPLHTQTSPTPTPLRAFYYCSTARMVMRTQPTMSPRISARMTEIADETPTPRLPIHTTWEDPEDGTVYVDIKCDMPHIHSPVQTLPSPVQIPSSSGWSPELLSNTPLELRGSILHNHTKRLDALPPTLLRVMVRTLLSCLLGHSDAQRVALWQARYEDHREIHDLRMQRAADQRELQELRGRAATLERRRRTARLHTTRKREDLIIQ